MTYRGRAGHIIILYVFFHLFEKKSLFRSSYNTTSSVIVDWETRLTENGTSPEPNQSVGSSLIPQIQAHIHPNLIVLPVTRSKARIVVFASRKAIPELWPFCSS